ncbi:MAG TPA: choice-of-anchor tandem repeat NxxGxxAF-containing protein, partial [Gemmataceae bacterium]|nr:choice-of-anchor tandem repeat NxxGxxAF-containing protein [Gemmataceae bacterium]
RYDNASTTTQIARSLTNNFSTFLGDPALNSSGTVLFKATLLTGGNGLFLGSGGAITTVTSTQVNPALQDIGGWSVINNAGQVAYWSSLVGGGDAVFLYENGTTTTVAASGGVFSQLSNPALNGHGRVAFTANLTAGGRGLFVGPDPVADRVVMLGDPLFGSTVTGLAIGPRAFNDAGQLAFYATLADGREGVFVATPVPEPGFALLGCAGVAALGRLLRRKEKNRRRETRHSDFFSTRPSGIITPTI